MKKEKPPLKTDKRLMAAIKAAKITPYALARLSGVSESHVYDIVHLKRRPGLQVARKLAAVLKVSIDDIFPNG